MQKGIKKVLAILGIILAIGVIGFVCKDPIVNALFYNMDAEMDLPKDLKSDPKYAPSSSSKEDKEDKTEKVYAVKVKQMKKTEGINLSFKERKCMIIWQRQI